ncbi:MAG: hypothetical protein Q8K30_05090 [Candidatus Gracilibacteria bacterium]|nr:hypothetical protein [Candidatus Gracilibacteria bacterium]
MKLDKNLKFAEKYNWWSTDKGNISKETKLSYIMSKGSIYEVYYVFKNFDTYELEKGYSLIKNDSYSLKPRRKSFINTLFEEKKVNYL